MTGTPIRDPRAIDREAARERLGIPAAPRLLLVFGGSQAVRRFNAAVSGALERLVERCWVLHVTGEAGHAEMLAARDALPPERRERYRPFPFLAEEMTAALAAADLVVGRAGSSTLAEAAAFGLPIVCVPYPARGRPPARQRRGVRGDGRGAGRGRRGLRCRRAGRGGPAARRPGRASRDERGGAGRGEAGCGRRGRPARAGGRDARGVPVGGGDRPDRRR